MRLRRARLKLRTMMALVAVVAVVLTVGLEAARLHRRWRDHRDYHFYDQLERESLRDLLEMEPLHRRIAKRAKESGDPFWVKTDVPTWVDWTSPAA